jgi:hypothetical protein
MQVLRASCLGRTRHCGQSRKGEITINEESEDSSIGSCVHAALSASIEGGGFEFLKLMEVYGVPKSELKEVEYLYYSGLKTWEKVNSHFIDPECEDYLSVEIGAFPFQFLLTGHIDVCSISDDVAFVLDWKTGQQKSSVIDQLYAYARLIFDAYPEVQKVQVMSAWVRLQEDDLDIEKPVDRADVAIWEEKLLTDLKNNEDKYNVGEWCRYCPRNGECPANTANIQSCLAIIKTEGDDWEKGKTKFELVHTLASRWETFKMIKDMVDKRVEQARQILLDQIAAAGPVELDGGMELTMKEVGGKYDWDGKKTVELLKTKGFSDDEINSAATFTMGDLTSIVGAKAAKGCKGKDIEALKDELKTKGAAIQGKSRHLITQQKKG